LQFTNGAIIMPVHRASKRRDLMLRAFIFCTALAAFAGCPGDDPLTHSDGGVGQGDGGGNTGDAGDAGPPPPAKLEETQSITSGGGQGASENFRVRITIGGGAGVGQAAGATHKANLGAGAAQTGQ
jgi:hypothetical protein